MDGVWETQDSRVFRGLWRIMIICDLQCKQLDESGKLTTPLSILVVRDLPVSVMKW